MWLASLRNPSAGPRKCSRRTLIASVGPLLVPGRSKETQHIHRAMLQRAAQPGHFDQLGRHPATDRVNQLSHQGLTQTFVLAAVCLHRRLIHTLDRFYLDMLLVRKHPLPSACLLVSGQVRTSHGDMVETVGRVNQHAATFLDDRGVRGAPCHPEYFREPGHGEMLAQDPSQRLLQCVAGQAGAGWVREALDTSSSDPLVPGKHWRHSGRVSWTQAP